MGPVEASPFAAMARLLEAEPDLTHTLEQITDLAKRELDCDYAGITLLHGHGRVETAAATDLVVEKGDALQYEVGEGPCLQAIWSHETFVVEDLRADARWPQWGPQAAELGLSSLLAVRLFGHDGTHGALNLYAATPRRFSEDDVAAAHIFTTHASVALAAARESEHLRKAVDARHVVGLAQGILMERFGIDADRAFGVLRRYSQDNNTKLAEIARRVVQTRDRAPEHT